MQCKMDSYYFYTESSCIHSYFKHQVQVHLVFPWVKLIRHKSDSNLSTYSSFAKNVDINRTLHSQYWVNKYLWCAKIHIFISKAKDCYWPHWIPLSPGGQQQDDLYITKRIMCKTHWSTLCEEFNRFLSWSKICNTSVTAPTKSQNYNQKKDKVDNV